MKKAAYVLLAFSLAASAQEQLTNESVVKMIKAGLGETVILSMIQTQPGKFSVTPDDLVKLKQQGVTDKELAAMISKNANAGGGPAKSSESATDNSANLDLPTNMDVGLYYKKGGRWEEMLPEIVNWKTGGMMKSLVSGGMVKGDVNGHLEGTNSRNSVTSPLEVVIDAPEGVAITEYQLLHLRVHEDAREFRTVTGGVLHVSGGATRDVVPFEGKKVSKGVYRVVLPNLGAGEYGFLPPGAMGSSNSASIGKMYTFRVIE